MSLVIFKSLNVQNRFHFMHFIRYKAVVVIVYIVCFALPVRFENDCSFSIRI